MAAPHHSRRAPARLRTCVSLGTGLWVPLWLFVRHQGRRRIVSPEVGARSGCVVVLGAPVRNGVTLTLEDRLLTALELCASPAVHRLLLTGTPEEVAAMRAYVERAGLREGVELVSDPLGTHTFESLARLPRETPVCLVSQRFHLPRALYVAERLGVEACGVAADRRRPRHLRRFQAREVVSSVLAFWMSGGKGSRRGP